MCWDHRLWGHGGLNTSSNVIKLDTSEARQVRAFRLGNFGVFVFLASAIPNPHLAVPFRIVTGKERDAHIDAEEWVNTGPHLTVEMVEALGTAPFPPS
jgi:hypothetical protein